MSEQMTNPEKPDLRMNAQKFEDALRTVLTTPKEVVQKRMEATGQQRKEESVAKQK
jgi:hypothetical protein